MAQTDQSTRVVFFIGFAHSGHSLIGALIDAHSDAMIANEVNFFDVFRLGPLTADSGILLLMEAARKNGEPTGWKNTGYDYQFSIGHHGTYRKLSVVGDKRGGGTSKVLRTDPNILSEVYQLYGKRLRLLSVIRSPFDTIAAMSARREIPITESLVQEFFEQANSVLLAATSLDASLLQILWHEKFILEPEKELRCLYEFLGLEVNSDFVSALCKNVKRSPNERSKKIERDSHILSLIRTKMACKKYSMLFWPYL